MALVWRDGHIVDDPSVNPPTLTPQEEFMELKDRIAKRVSETLNAKAKEYRYDDIHSACSYVGDANPKYAAEGEAFFQWRSTVWTHIDNLEAMVLNGDAPPPPSVEYVIDNLPPFPLG